MYTLYCYNKNDNVYNEFKHFSKMQRAKDFVDTRYEIQELESYKWLQIHCKDGYTVIKPSSNNVLHVSTDKL